MVKNVRQKRCAAFTDRKRHEGELWRAMYALIINPISGNGRGKRELPRVEALLRRDGNWRCEKPEVASAIYGIEHRRTESDHAP